MSTRSTLDRYREGSLSHNSYIPLNAGDNSNPASDNRFSSSSRFSRRSLAALTLGRTSSALNNLVFGSPSPRSPSPGSLSRAQSPYNTRSQEDYFQSAYEKNNTNGGGGIGGRGDSSTPSRRLSTDTLDQLPPSVPPNRVNNGSPVANRRHTLQGSSRFTPTHSPNQDPGFSMPSSKMHQTSSRLLRMTSDERPFTRDFKDLFSTLMVSLKLDSHRVRFTKFDHSFMSEEAINNLGSLKFSQSNRMPDPKDPSRIVTTTTTTTFSMAKEMARTVCQRFVDARFVEPVDGRVSVQFPLKGTLFQLTPKGIHILQRFCQRNGITARHVMEVLESPRNTMQLVILERDRDTDQVSHDRSTIEVIFRRFAGQDGPNIKSSVATSDNDSLSDYANGIAGVKMAKERKIGDKIIQNSFTGKGTVDWLMDCCTTIDMREPIEIAGLFVQAGLMAPVVEDKGYMQQVPHATAFQPTKYAVYCVTEHGQRVCGWIPRERVAPSSAVDRNAPRDSNNARLNHILQDAALRLLFREFLRDSLCEENLSFYVDVSEFTSNYHRSEKAGLLKKMDAVRETLASAYGLYNAFLAPGSPCELNIEHALRNSLASRMTRAVGDDASMVKSLTEVVGLFELAQVSVFKLMSSDSVPKFIRDPKFSLILQEHDFDLNASGRAYSPTPAPIPERSMSRSTRSR